MQYLIYLISEHCFNIRAFGCQDTEYHLITGFRKPVAIFTVDCLSLASRLTPRNYWVRLRDCSTKYARDIKLSVKSENSAAGSLNSSVASRYGLAVVIDSKNVYW